MSQPLAVDILYKWFKDNANTFSNEDGVQMEFRDSGNGAGFVRVDTYAFMSDIQVKDKDYRIEIERINRDTDEVTFPYAGTCDSQAEFDKQLAEFIAWFESAHA